MKFTQTPLPGVVLVEPRVFRDDRGFFLETYHQDRYQEGGIPETFVQDNHSRSSHGILRGLHAQRAFAQGKLVRCVEGEIWDVAVDIRRGSPSFKQWFAAKLSAENFHQLYIPPNFAHGFCVLSESAQVEYKCTELYHPEEEISIRWDDPDLGISWPIAEPTLSAKDREALPLAQLLEQLPRHPDPDH